MAFIQSAIATSGGTLNFTNIPALDNLLIVVLTNNSPIAANSISDNVNNNYTQIADQATSSTGDHVSVWWAVNASSVGPTSVTGTSGACLAIYEYAGYAAISPIDQTAHTNGSSGTPSTSVTTTIDNELYFVAEVDAQNAASYTAVAPFTLRQTQTDTSTHERQAAEDLVRSRGTVTGSMTVGATGQWAIIMASFKPYNGSPSGNQLHQIHVLDGMSRSDIN